MPLRLTVTRVDLQVNGNPGRQETEEISSIWQTGLWNNHIQCERFMLEDDRVIFMFHVSLIFMRAGNSSLFFLNYRPFSFSEI